MPAPVEFTPCREVHCADAMPWLRACGVMSGVCAVTSLPDVSELNLPLPAWRAWFLEAVRLVVDAVPAESAARFFQSDIKRDGACPRPATRCGGPCPR